MAYLLWNGWLSSLRLHLRINSQYHTDTHVEGVVHHLLVDIASLCHQIKDRRYGVAVFLYNGYGVVFEHTRNVPRRSRLR